MKTEQDSRKNLSSYLLEVSRKLSAMEKRSRYYGTDTKLYESEINLIKVVGENPGMHLSAIADQMNITRGAVSQVIGRLRQKGMVIKKPDSKYKSRIQIGLTARGEKAYRNHEQMRAEFDRTISKLMKPGGGNSREIILGFFSAVSKRLDSWEEYEKQTQESGAAVFSGPPGKRRA
ncbi:MarR family transcriptional regulator [Brucepastera parasyntrophica]|uniref:MarR family winged helix-turn-helix transcriptional regulator n=1 Tax=Brucepastera parasyntrophica TaxID=2880008 RepID=UPI00210BA306|nr:MarR family transcriptional regulator [Brucepastera parasyntrophica]ULQ60299.1 MarR family transcriptional regulator [Brucepastera parasyntrophica]